jgi:hypothetical protein
MRHNQTQFRDRDAYPLIIERANLLLGSRPFDRAASGSVPAARFYHLGVFCRS